MVLEAGATRAAAIIETVSNMQSQNIAALEKEWLIDLFVTDAFSTRYWGRMSSVIFNLLDMEVNAVILGDDMR